MRRLIFRGLLAAAAPLLLGSGVLSSFFACGAPTTQGPEYTKHPTSALIEVPYPPPPARVEVVPKQPNDNAVWIDGEWTWQTRRWAWKPGRWITPPPNAKFAPWTTVRDKSGTLYYATGLWRDAKGGEVEEPAPLAIGKPTPASIVSPEGEDVPRGPLAPIDSGVSKNGTLDDSGLNEAVERLDASRTTMPLPLADGGDSTTAPSVEGDQ